MKYFNAVISIFLLTSAIYVMVEVRDITMNMNDLPMILGFGIMLMGIIFFLFMLLEERKEEIEKLRKIITHLK